MRLRGVPTSLIVDSRITATKAGLDLSTDDLESHYLAEGNLLPTVRAIIAAQKANISLDWAQACAIDLATKGTSKSVQFEPGVQIIRVIFPIFSPKLATVFCISDSL